MAVNDPGDTAAVHLRRLRADDVDVVVGERRPASGAFGGPTRDQLLARVDDPPTIERDGFVEWAVDSSGELVGTLQVRAPLRGFPPGVCELGINLFAAARGRGVGRRAIEAVTADLLGAGWARVQASTAVGNVAMQRVLAHCGYRCEATMASFGPRGDGTREDYQLWALIAPVPT